MVAGAAGRRVQVGDGSDIGLPQRPARSARDAVCSGLGQGARATRLARRWNRRSHCTPPAWRTAVRALHDDGRARM